MSRMIGWLWAVATSGLLLAVQAAEGPEPASLVSPALPAWVHTPLEVDPTASSPDPTASLPVTPTRIHLVECQVDVARAEEFRHYASRVETEAGLQQSGQVSVVFAPAYQKLHWHFLRVWRDGKPRDVLEPAAIQVLRQEENAERFLYHGRMTALVLLHDIRVGDVVEWAYTITGQNPVFGGRFSTLFVCTSGIPMDRLYYRVIGAPRHPLQIATLGGFQTVHQQTAVNGCIEHTWTAAHIPAVSPLNDVPPGECQYSYIEVTDYTGWNDVRGWARALFDDGSKPTPEIMARVQPLLAGCKTAEAKADVLLRFVQDDIRYLGLNLNEGTHRPAPPLDVLERRFGDCKDKSQLLVALLRGIGLQADVALVNSTWQRGLRNLQPSPLAFDHAIVRVLIPDAPRPVVPPSPPTYGNPVRSGLFDSSFDQSPGTNSLHLGATGTVLWIDPTATLQGGDFEHRSVSPFGFALVLDNTGDDLSPVTPLKTTEGLVDVKETYTVPDYTSPVTLEILTTYQGALADYYRYFRRNADMARYTQQMTGFLARYYPKIKALGPIEWTDDRGHNVLTSRLQFEVQEFWTIDASKQHRLIEVYPWALADRMPRPDTIDRKFAFALPHPITVSQNTTLFLPKDWPASKDSQEINDDTFVFRMATETSGRRVDLHYEWRSLADSVPAAHVREWNNKMGEVRATFGYRLQQNIRLAEAVKHQGIVWSVVVCCAVGLLGGIVLGVALYRWRPAARSRPMNSRHLAGLGGWLILVGLGILIRPLFLLKASKPIFDLMGNSVGWITLTDPQSGGYQAGYAWLVWGESCIQTLLLGWSIVMIPQFFRRKPSLPHSLSALLIVIVVVGIADRIAITCLKMEVPSSSLITSQVLVAVVWIWYLQVSRRVRVTFRTPSIKSEPPPLPDSLAEVPVR